MIFNYVAAKEVDEVIHLLSQTGNDACIILWRYRPVGTDA